MIIRNLNLISDELLVNGKSDVVEFLKDSIGVKLDGRSGFWRIVPVEYKSGRKSNKDIDKFQLCLEALCLEEMYNCVVEYGFLYYGKNLTKELVIFDDILRSRTIQIVDEMRGYLNNGFIPKDMSSKCEKCSLKELCFNINDNSFDYLLKLKEAH